VSRGIAKNGHTLWDIAGDHRTGPDHGIDIQDHAIEVEEDIRGQPDVPTSGSNSRSSARLSAADAQKGVKID
jgi:hypothetical protein